MLNLKTISQIQKISSFNQLCQVRPVLTFKISFRILDLGFKILLC